MYQQDYQIVYKDPNKKSHWIRKVDDYLVADNMHQFKRQGVVVWTESVNDVAQVAATTRRVEDVHR